MSWSTASGDHEGWAAHYFEDGNVSCGWANGGPIGADRYPALPALPAYGVLPDLWWDEQESLGAVAVCVCGWRGSRRPRRAPEGAAADECHAEWLHHVDFWEPADTFG